MGRHCSCSTYVTSKQTQCTNCGKLYPDNIEKSKAQKRTSRLNNPNAKIRCPKCKSTNLSSGKKGFSGQKAVGGALLTGGIGLLAGTIGSNKVQLWCLSCGNKFKPGEDLQGLRRKRKQQEEMNAWMDDVPGCIPILYISAIIIIVSFIYLLFS